ncbi:MAG TPA: calcium/sodium antiporter [Planctomycetota bacterium]|nr:calcium/sodium antiporter [Planctomycetota bacterium]
MPPFLLQDTEPESLVMDWMVVVLFLAGLALLPLGAEALVRGASRLAAAAGVSSLVIGLTVVAFGTSAPEMAVSVKASWSGQADLAVGNVVGSNIFNVLFILGASALITPLLVARDLVRRDVPLMVALSGIVLWMAHDGRISRLEGVLLFLGLIVYTVWIVRASRSENVGGKAPSAASVPNDRSSVTANIALVVVGLAMLVLGSGWLVDGAVQFARWMGVSDVVVGLTIVAAGTSLPEVATSILATLRGERDIAVGNVVGSNIFNIMGVLGLSGIVASDGIPVLASLQRFDIPVMIAVALACLPIFARGCVIPRWEGLLFLAYYAAYTTWLVLDALEHAAKDAYASAMVHYAVPLTALALAVLAFRARASRS